MLGPKVIKFFGSGDMSVEMTLQVTTCIEEQFTNDAFNGFIEMEGTSMLNETSCMLEGAWTFLTLVFSNLIMSSQNVVFET